MDAGVNEGSILGPLLFLIYINDLSYDLSTNAKLFADDTSLFSVILDINTSATHLNNELRKMSNWAFQWKMSFNPDPSKKTPKNKSSQIYFNSNPIEQVSSQKHLGMILDAKLNFQEHIKNLLTKANKTITKAAKHLAPRIIAQYI